MVLVDCEDCVDWMRLENGSEFKCLGCFLDASGTNESEFRMKRASGRRIAGANRSLVTARGLQHEFLASACSYV